MRITRIDTDFLKLPLARMVALPLAGGKPGPLTPTQLNVLLVHVHTDEDVSGLGLTYSLQVGRAMQAVLEDDLAPRLIGEHPLHHERLSQRIRHELPGLASGGLVTQCYGAIDVALWDLKGKVAGLPLHQLLGGCRDAATAYAAETATSGLTAEQVLAAARPLLDKGVRGLRVSVGGLDPEGDAQKLLAVREAVGDEVWFGVTAEQGYDVGTALAFGRFVAEELDADWFEDPCPSADLDGFARLCQKLDVPIAVGSVLQTPGAFAQFVRHNAADVLRPDVRRLGGVTNWLRVAAVAEVFHKPVIPHLLPEIGVHFACGLTGVQAVETVNWLDPILTVKPELVGGLLVPPAGPGLGLELNPDAVQRYRQLM